MGAHILVVDDDPLLAAALRRPLAYEGFEVEVAASGEEALGRALDHPPDLVILDVLLPGIDGLEVCRRLRQAGEVAVLMLTARSEVPERVAGFEAGADDYLVKPFAFEELRVWDYDFGRDSNVLEVYVGYLRRKLEAEGEPRVIHTVRGVGYVLREDPEGSR